MSSTVRFSLTTAQVEVIADGLAATYYAGAAIADGRFETEAAKSAARHEVWQRSCAKVREALVGGGCPESSADEWLATIVATMTRRQEAMMPVPVTGGGMIGLASIEEDEDA